MMLSFSHALRRSLLKSVCVAVNGPICRIDTSLYTLPRRGSTSSLNRGAAFSWTDRFLAVFHIYGASCNCSNTELHPHQEGKGTLTLDKLRNTGGWYQAVGDCPKCLCAQIWK